jgi:hypothetical protein
MLRPSDRPKILHPKIQSDAENTFYYLLQPNQPHRGGDETRYKSQYNQHGQRGMNQNNISDSEVYQIPLPKYFAFGNK